MTPTLSDVMTTTTNYDDVNNTSYVTADVSDTSYVTRDISTGGAEAMLSTSCMLVNSSAQLVRDDSVDLVSINTVMVMNSVKSSVAIPLFFFLGFPTNVLNLVVFFRQGLAQRINTCLFALSLVDLLYLTFAFLMYAENMQPHDFTSPNRPVGVLVVFIINNYLLGCFGLNWASWFISAAIAGERCFCVLWPLKSATLLKTRTMAVVLVLGVVLITGGRFAVTEKYRSVCLVDVVTGMKNRILAPSQYYLNHKELVDALDGVVYGLLIPLFTCLFVLVTTSITAIMLKKSLQFRKESSSLLPAREVALTRMLIFLSLQFAILQLPNALLRVSLLFLPKLNSSGDWRNFFFFVQGVVEICAAINASLNFVVYCCFGSKYRQTVREIFATCIPRSKAKARDAQGGETRVCRINTKS